MKVANLNHLNCSGIYVIRNLHNNKVYIGSAINIRRRFHEHNSYFRRKIHHSTYLQHTYDKYPNSLLFSIIERVKDHKDLIKREQYWMDYYLSYNKKHGYNQKPKADSCLGKKLSDKTKAKIGAKIAVPIIVIFNDESTQRFESQLKAAKALGCHRSIITYNLLNKTFSRTLKCKIEYA